MVQKERDWVDEESRDYLLRKRCVLQHIGSDGGSIGVGYYNNFVEVVCGEDLRDRKTGSLSIERGTSYPVADWEYLVGTITTGKSTKEGMTIPPQ